MYQGQSQIVHPAASTSYYTNQSQLQIKPNTAIQPNEYQLQQSTSYGISKPSNQYLNERVYNVNPV
jgi:hypothetical protein